MGTTTPTTPTTDASAVLADAAASLAAGGTAALPAVLDDLVRAAGLRSAVLRDASGDLAALAGDVVHAVPVGRVGCAPEPVVELPVRAGAVRLATLTVVGARSAQLPLLRAVCAVVGLALVQHPAPPRDALPLALLEAADDAADEAADALHDGPVQDLVAARLVADAATRGGDAVAARDAVQGALQSLRRALWFLRPRGSGDGGLPRALEQLSARLAEAGRPPLVLDLDVGACGRLGPHAASLAYRLVQSLAARVDERPSAVAVRLTGDVVELHVDAARPLAAADRWAARARAVGGGMAVTRTGAVVLLMPLPEQPDPLPAHDDEAI